LYLSDNKQRLVTHKLIGFYNRDENCLLRGTNSVKQSALRLSEVEGDDGQCRATDGPILIKLKTEVAVKTSNSPTQNQLNVICR
jgi:hypothetical protein